MLSNALMDLLNRLYFEHLTIIKLLNPIKTQLGIFNYHLINEME